MLGVRWHLASRQRTLTTSCCWRRQLWLPLQPFYQLNSTISDQFLTLWSALYSESTRLYLNALLLFSILTFLLFSNSSVTDQHQHCRYFFPQKQPEPFSPLPRWGVDPTQHFLSTLSVATLLLSNGINSVRRGRGDARGVSIMRGCHWRRPQPLLGGRVGSCVPCIHCM